jgi:hypothetical protein
MTAGITFILNYCTFLELLLLRSISHFIQEKQHCTSDVFACVWLEYRLGRKIAFFFFNFSQLWRTDFGILLNFRLCPHHSMYSAIYFSVMTLQFGAM